MSIHLYAYLEFPTRGGTLVEGVIQTGGGAQIPEAANNYPVSAKICFWLSILIVVALIFAFWGVGSVIYGGAINISDDFINLLGGISSQSGEGVAERPPLSHLVYAPVIFSHFKIVSERISQLPLSDHLVQSMGGACAPIPPDRREGRPLKG